jgi:hypothetical protein
MVPALNARTPDGRAAQLAIAVRDTSVARRRRNAPASSGISSRRTRPPPRKHGGTGLGLAVCHQLVESMRGRFEVDSEEGRSSIFQITLCLPIPDPSLELSHLSPRAPEPLGWRVLPAEDGVNQPIAERSSPGRVTRSMWRTAASTGFGRSRAADSIACLGTACRGYGLDGCEFTAEIRREKAAARTPVAAKTANAMQGTANAVWPPAGTTT